MTSGEQVSILVAGGGFGGLQVAKHFNDWIEKENIKNVQVTMIEKRHTFAIGGTFQFALMRKHEKDHMYFNVPYKKLKFKHVRVIHDHIIDIDPNTRTVVTRNSTYSANHLVVALGMDYQPDVVPGLKDAAHNICSLEDVICLREAMTKFKQGNIVVLVARKPYKCPPAPFEYVCLLDDLATQAGAREKANLMVITPDPTPVPLKNPKPIQDILAAYNIEFKGNHVVKEVDPMSRHIKFEDGSELKYEILAATYPQKPPSCIEKLSNEKGFIPVDVMTMKTKFENVFAIGDNVHAMLPLKMPKPHPKAGGFAINQARPVAEAIIDAITNKAAWDATTFKQQDVAVCYGEVGYDKEVIIEIDLFTTPSDPQFKLSDPRADNPTKKIDWVKQVIHEWFFMEKPSTAARSPSPAAAATPGAGAGASASASAGATDTGNVKANAFCCC